MQDEQPHKDASPAQPVDASPESAQEQPVNPDRPRGGEADSATFEHEQESIQNTETKEAVSGDVSDDAPDVDEPGDDAAPEELAQHQQAAPDQPDEVDQGG